MYIPEDKILRPSVGLSVTVFFQKSATFDLSRRVDEYRTYTHSSPTISAPLCRSQDEKSIEESR